MGLMSAKVALVTGAAARLRPAIAARFIQEAAAETPAARPLAAALSEYLENEMKPRTKI